MEDNRYSAQEPETEYEQEQQSCFTIRLEPPSKLCVTTFISVEQNLLLSQRPSAAPSY
jgi:hypothetical protein